MRYGERRRKRSLGPLASGLVVADRGRRGRCRAGDGGKASMATPSAGATGAWYGARLARRAANSTVHYVTAEYLFNPAIGMAAFRDYPENLVPKQMLARGRGSSAKFLIAYWRKRSSQDNHSRCRFCTEGHFAGPGRRRAGKHARPDARSRQTQGHRHAARSAIISTFWRPCRSIDCFRRANATSMAGRHAATGRYPAGNSGVEANRNPHDRLRRDCSSRR